MKIEVIVYRTNSGKVPFEEWLTELDIAERKIIITRLNRIRIGNFGDCKKIQGARNLFELRIEYGGGYRIYIAKKDDTVVLLLVGGIKRTQKRDIEKAKEYLDDYLEKK